MSEFPLYPDPERFGRERENDTVAALREQLSTLRAENERLKQERDELKEQVHLFNPHPNGEGCPTFYDGCHCTVETLKHNINRAETAERQIAALRDALTRIIGAAEQAIDEPHLDPEYIIDIAARALVKEGQ